MKIYMVRQVLYDWDFESSHIIGYYKDKDKALESLHNSVKDNWKHKEFVFKEPENPSHNTRYIRESDCQTEYYYMETINVIV